MFSSKITTFTELTAIQEGTGELASHPPQPCTLNPPLFLEATGVCLPVGNDLQLSLLSCPWSDADVIELLGFQRKTILAGDLNAKHKFWNSSVSKPPGKELLELFHKNEFEISASQYPTHNSPARNGDTLDIVFYQNIRLSDVTVSDVLDSDHLPIIFYLLEHVKVRNLSKPIEKLAGNSFRTLPLN
jgi:hypothetical protein